MIVLEFAGLSVRTIIRIVLFSFFAIGWSLLALHKRKKKQALKESASLREKIRNRQFTSSDIPVISYVIKEGVYEAAKISFKDFSNLLTPGLLFGSADFPLEILANIPVAENKLILAIEATYEDPDFPNSDVKKKFALVKILFIECSYSPDSNKYLFRSPYFMDNPEKSLLRRIVFVFEDILLAKNREATPQ